MANFGAGDVPALLRDLGVPITLGANTTKGIVDRVDGRLLVDSGEMAAALGLETVVTLQRGALVGLDTGSSVTVDGAPMTVASVLSIEDGELVRIVVRNP